MTKYRNLIPKTPNEIHNELTRKGLPPAIVEQIKGDVMSLKAHIKSQRAQRIKLQDLWKPLTQELAREKASVRSMRNYKRGHDVPERVEALDAYWVVLGTLQKKFQTMRRNKLSPAQVAREKGIPNAGTHWIDWVPAHIRDRVTKLFAEIPPVKHATTKVPFTRSLSEAEWHKQVARLKTRTLTELDTAQRTVDAMSGRAPEHLTSRMSKLHAALLRIGRLGPTDPVPRTWHGLKGDTVSLNQPEGESK
jgi:hypothetical protein